LLGTTRKRGDTTRRAGRRRFHEEKKRGTSSTSTGQVMLHLEGVEQSRGGTQTKGGRHPIKFVLTSMEMGTWTSADTCYLEQDPCVGTEGKRDESEKKK